MVSAMREVRGYQVETDPTNVPSGPPMMGRKPGKVRPMPPERRRTAWGEQ